MRLQECEEEGEGVVIVRGWLKETRDMEERGERKDEEIREVGTSDGGELGGGGGGRGMREEIGLGV